MCSSASNGSPAVVAKPESVKSSTGRAPASVNNHGSPPAPVPVTLAAPTRRRRRRSPTIKCAAVVVLPAFMLEPTTATTRGGRTGGGGPSAPPRPLVTPPGIYHQPRGPPNVDWLMFGLGP